MTDEPRQLLALLFAQQGDRLRQLAPSSPRGWAELQTRCARLGATGLLHAALRRTRCTDLAPADVRAALRLGHAANAAQNLALCVEAERILKALGGAQVVAAPIKGVALFREHVVEDLGARPTGDFDLVTRRADRRAVLRTLGELGYEPRFEDLSWKHLPPMTRGDLSVEVHEVAYWSSTTRAVFRADHLTTPDRPRRLGRLAALQVHHLVFGSPPDSGLTVRTLGDVDAFLQLARRDDALGGALRAAAEEAGVASELAAMDGLLAEARGEAPVLGIASRSRGATSARVDIAAQSLIRSMLPAPDDSRGEILAHAFRMARIQPWHVTRDMLAILLFPPRESIARRIGAATGSRAVTIARLRRPFELAGHVLRALPVSLHARPGRRTR